MFKITGKKSGVVWDAEKNRALIRFDNGVAETDDQAIADKLKALGYTVSGDAKKTPKSM